MAIQKKNNYRSDIDGLRAIAVVSVLFFHLGASSFSGGFVGVDVFFVISGFLITRLIKEEIDTTGTFDFKNFYIRRIRRLFPALFVTLIITTIAASLLLSPTHLQRFGGALTSALVSVANFYFWLEADYFDVSAQLKPLLHTWSLSIEEQFYLIWPTTIFLIHKLKGKWKKIVVLLILSCLSLSLNLVFSDGSVSLISHYSEKLKFWIADGRATIFFLMPFRVFEFTIGALVVWLLKYRIKSKSFHNSSFFLGFGLITYAVVTFNDEMLFPSYYALAPCLGTALLLYSGAKSHFSYLLTNKVSVGIGLISYSLYLVHWPLIVFWSYMTSYMAKDVSIIDKTAIAAISLLLGYLGYRFVEQPFRKRGNKIAPHFWKVSSIFAVFLVAILGIHMKQNGGWFWRVSCPESLVDLSNAGEFHEEFYGGAGYPEEGPVNTMLPADIFLMGDSHGRQYAEGIYKEWAEPEGKSLYLGPRRGFLHLPFFTRTTEGKNWDSIATLTFFRDMEFIRNSKNNPIVIVAHAWLVQIQRADILNNQGRRQNIYVDIQHIIAGLSALKKQIGDSPLIVIGEVPTSGGKYLYDIMTRPRLPFISQFTHSGDHLKSALDPRYSQFNQFLYDAAQKTNDFIFLNPLEALCDEGICRNLDDQNRPLYSDKAHLSKFGSREVIRAFLPQLKKLSTKPLI